MSNPAFNIDIQLNSATAQQQLAALGAQLGSLGSRASGASGPLGGLGQGLGGLGSSARAANDNLGRLGSTLGSISPSLGNMANNLAGVGRAAAGSATGMRALAMAGAAAAVALPIVAVAAFAKQIFDATAKTQEFKAQLTTLLGDTATAGEAFNALSDFAAKTPFTLDQAVEGFSKLRALGLEPSERAMLSYGNTAAVMGKGLNDMVEAVADASVGEFERLKEFGIKAKSEGDNVAFTFQGVTTTVGKNSKEIQDYLMQIGETEFAGAMERQAETINGKLSTLSDTIFQMFASLGEGEVGSGITDYLDYLIDVIGNDVQPALQGFMSAIVSIGSAVSSIISPFVDLFSTASEGLGDVGSLGEWIGLIFEGLGATIELVGAIVGGAFQVMFSVIKGVGEGIASVFEWCFGSATDSAVESSKEQEKAGLWAQTRWIDRLRGMVAAMKAFARSIPVIFKAGIASVTLMFAELGKRVQRFFGGDWNAFDGFTAAIGNIGAKFGKIVGDNFTAAVKQGAAATIESYTASQRKAATGDRLAKYGMDIADPASGDSEKGGKGSKGKGGKTDAERAADAAAKREESLAKYIEGLQKAAVFEQESLGLNERQLEIKKATEKAVEMAGRALTEAETKSIEAAIATKMEYEDLASISEKIKKIQSDAALSQADFMDKLIYGEEEGARIAARRKTIEAEIAALKARGADVDKGDLKAKLDELEALLSGIDTNAGIEGKIGDWARVGRGERERNQSIGDVQAEYEKNLKSLNDYFDKQIIESKGNAEKIKRIEEARAVVIEGAGYEFKKRVEEAGEAFQAIGDQIAGAVSDIFGSKAGGAVGGLFGAIDIFNKTKKLDANGFGALDLSNASSPFARLADGIKGLNTKIGGPQGLTNALGKFGAGAEMGAAIAPIGKALLGSKFSSTGSQIGGAIGSFVPIPGGQIIGSVLGGLVGGLFKKAKYGTANLVNGDSTLSGNKDAYKQAASGAAGSVQQGLQNIADALGVSVGNYSLSIGQYKGKWRVRDEAWTEGKTGKLDFKGNSANGLHDFGKDGEAEAIAYAITNALKDGAIDGVSDFAKRVLTKATSDTLDSMVDLAAQYEAMLKELDGLGDPFTAGLKNITTAMDKMVDAMRDAGATAGELAKVEEYRSLQVSTYLEDQLSTLEDFKKSLDGEGSGLSKMTRLRNAQDDLAGFKADIAAGKTVDQDAFVEAANTVYALAGEIYGSSTREFQAIRAEIQGLTDNAITNFKTVAEGETQKAIMESNQAVAANTAITNDLLSQINIKLGTGGTVAATLPATKTAVNGSYNIDAVNYRFLSL